MRFRVAALAAACGAVALVGSAPVNAAGFPTEPAALVTGPRQCSPPPSDQLAPGSAGERLQLEAVRELATGAGQLVAVIDTGVAPHPRLGGRLVGGGDYVAGGGALRSGGLEDCDGHGTLVAGLLAAAPSRDDDVAGIAPGARILSIRQSSPSFLMTAADGSTTTAGDTATLAAAIDRAVALGATVVNISEAVCVPAELADAVDGGLGASLRAAADADVVVVAAAGNVGTAADGSDGGCRGAGSGQVPLPGHHEDLLAVGAVGPDDRPAPFTVPGPWVDLAAPGTGLRSLAVDGGLTSAGVDGTSFAAPWVAGVAALVRERYPQLRAGQVADRLRATARRPAGPADEFVGHGVLDPLAALTAVPDVLVPSRGSTPPRPAPLPGTATAAAPSGPPGWLLLTCPLLLATAAAAATRRPR